MTRARAGRWGPLLAAVLVPLAGLVSLPPAAARPSAPGAQAEEPPTLELVRQSPTVPQGGLFELWLPAEQLAPDGSVELVLHGRVRSRSELDASMEGNSLRSTVHHVERPVTELPTGPGGSRRVTISFDPADPTGLRLSTAGVYPLEVVAKDVSGAVTASAMTHLLLEPDDEDESPPLSVALVAEVDAPVRRPPDGPPEIEEAELGPLLSWVSTLAAEDGPVNLAVDPSGLEALAARAAAEDDGPAAQVVEQLGAVAAKGHVVALPYAATSPDALAAAGLGSELAGQMERGAAALTNVLGVAPDGRTWLAGPDLDTAGLVALASRGVRHVVLEPGQVEPLRSGVSPLSLAQPFIVGDDDREPRVDGLVVDRGVLAHLGDDGSPGLEASRVLAELAMIWFERPGVARSLVLPLDQDVRPEVLVLLAEGLGRDRLFDLTSLEDAFTAASPLEQPGGGAVDRDLAPEDDPPRIAAEVRRELPATRVALDSFAALVGADDPRVAEAGAHLLFATSIDTARADQPAHVEAARAAIRDVTGAITTPGRETITLTAREGTIPLTIQNSGDGPVQATLHLTSSKLEFPDGAERLVTLEPGSTRMDISVRARASGSFPLVVEVTSPDGGLHLATIEYSIQSTAVAGLGVVLSAGAALFLLVWWARHWSRTRRSAKLVEAKHLAGGGEH